MRELPSGTVTFLFTDIEGSTKLLHELGDAYADALAEHRRALRSAFAAHGGVEVDTQGDAFFVAFARAGDALAAAREGQQALAEGPLRVRMGLHTGEPIVTDEGYVGIDVHRAARIAGVGHGGQVLVSQSTRELAGAGGLHDLGKHRLKDLTAPERIWQLGEADFPPLKSLNQSNLPQQPTPFVGREKELGEVLQLLGNPKIRLLTLTGAGGSGKTRLAVQAAADVTEEHEHGVWWVGLQAVRDAQLVLPTISATLGASTDLETHIGDKRMLLVLDNLEQVLGAASGLGELLAACPNLRLLATSRELLRIAAEREYAVPPFVEQEGVGFFLGRARAIRADFQPDEHLLEICRRLDNLPLALELAAARVRALSSGQILERLERSLPLLTGGPRDAPERQRTLGAAIGWSYELLGPAEQEAFRRLAVFAGGCTLDAAEQVTGADLDLLQSLLEKSLLRFDGERYSLLETIREFGVGQLEEAGEADDVRGRHAEHFLALAEAQSTAAEVGYRAPQDVSPDQDNFRAAIDWSLAVGEVELGLRVAVALEQFWVISDAWEGTRRFEALLAAADDVDPILRARALRCYSGSSHVTGNYDQAIKAAEESVGLYREAGDDVGAATVLQRIATARLSTGETAGVRSLLEESIELFHRAGTDRGEAEIVGTLGYLAQAQGELEKAAELYAESIAWALETGFDWWRRNMIIALADVLLLLGRVDEAQEQARESLSLSIALGDRRGKFWGLVLLAWGAAVRGDAARAGRLWGAAEVEEEERPSGQWVYERDLYTERVFVADGPEFSRGREIGRRLTLERAVEEELAAG